MHQTHFVKFLVELAELCGLSHNVLVHHEWGLNLFVAMFSEEVKGVGNKGLIEIDTVIGEKVASVADYLCACARLTER